MRTFLKLIFLILIIFDIATAKKLFIKNTQVKNLPKEYIDVFDKFLLENLENAYLYESLQNDGYIVVPYLSWIGISYNVCFDVYHKNYLVQMECFSPISGEDIVQDLYHLEKNITLFKFKKIKKKEAVLKFRVGTKPIVERLKIISPKGDILVSYVPIVFKSSDENTVDFGAGNLNLDTLILNYQQSKKLFELLLNNYKIKEILIIK